MRVPFLLAMAAAAPALAGLPEEFKQIFNGRDLAGWHISGVNHHGDTKAWTVRDGVLLATQEPLGNGGILLTDKRYRDFEVSLEVNPDFGCDGGVFLRSSEKGQAYQVMIDYLEGGNVGHINGEALGPLGFKFAEGATRLSDRDWRKHWKTGEWNHIRARIEGAVPSIRVWINGVPVLDWTDFANHLPDGATDGMIALQVHRNAPNWKSQRWKAGGYHRFRNIGVKELSK